MKKVEIKKFSFAEVDAPKEVFGFLKIPHEHRLIRAEGEELEVSDGYHTFDELYEHRYALFIALQSAYCRISEEWGYEGNETWKSKLHHDGTMFEGMFIAGIFVDEGQQITYHLPLSYWDETYGKILEKAPKWDGHTSDEVIQRLKNL